MKLYATFDKEPTPWGWDQITFILEAMNDGLMFSGEYKVDKLEIHGVTLTHENRQGATEICLGEDDV